MREEEIVKDFEKKFCTTVGAEELVVVKWLNSEDNAIKASLITDWIKETLPTYRAQVLEEERDKIWTQIHQMIAELPKSETKERESQSEKMFITDYCSKCLTNTYSGKVIYTLGNCPKHPTN
jgi:hypothetical protein